MALPNIGRAEMEVFRYILDHHPITVREVAEQFAADKGRSRTTILNMMERLRQKEYLKREMEEGLYRYSPNLPKTQLMPLLVRNFVEQSLGGSLEPFVAYLTQEAELSSGEVDTLRSFLDALDNGTGEKKR